MPRKRIPDISCKYMFTMVENLNEEPNLGKVLISDMKRTFLKINSQHGYTDETVHRFFSELDNNDSDRDGFLFYSEFRNAFYILKTAE